MSVVLTNMSSTVVHKGNKDDACINISILVPCFIKSNDYFCTNLGSLKVSRDTPIYVDMISYPCLKLDTVSSNLLINEPHTAPRQNCKWLQPETILIFANIYYPIIPLHNVNWWLYNIRLWWSTNIRCIRTRLLCLLGWAWMHLLSCVTKYWLVKWLMKGFPLDHWGLATLLCAANIHKPISHCRYVLWYKNGYVLARPSQS